MLATFAWSQHDTTPSRNPDFENLLPARVSRCYSMALNSCFTAIYLR